MGHKTVLHPEGGVPLFEREPEITAVEALVEGACAGDARLVVIEGPAGIGKTRLLAETVSIARAAGMRILTARAGELEGRFAFGVVRQLFERPLNEMKAEVRDEFLGGAAVHARTLFKASDADASVGEEQLSFAMLHSLYWLVANLSFAQPTLLAVDDLHWTDAPSLRWLDYLVRRLEGLPLLVAVATRPPEQQSAERSLVVGLIARSEAIALHPRPLGRASIARLALLRHGLEPDTVFSGALERETGGNPLFVAALLDAVARKGIAVTGEQASMLSELGGESVARAVGLRLAHLTEAELAVARAAAVFGDEAPLRLVSALVGTEAATAARCAEALVRFDLFRRTDPIEFSHPVVRSAVYETLGVAERGLAHRRAAELLLTDGSAPEAVAAHAIAAPHGADPFVVMTLRQAAERVLMNGAADAAVVYLNRALREESQTATRAEILAELGRAERRIDGPSACTHLEAALDLETDPSRRADVALDLGRTLWFSDRHEEARAVFGHALAEVDRERDADQYEHLVAELISSAWWEPQTYPVAETRLAELDPESLHGGPGSEVLLATMAHHQYRLGMDRDRSTDLARRALASGRLATSGSPAFSYATYAYVVAGLFDEALTVYDTSLAQARARGDIVHVASTLMWRGRCQTFRGRLESAVDDLREAAELSIAHGVRVSQPLMVGFLAEALLEHGDLDGAARVVADGGVPEEPPPNLLIGFHQLVRARVRIETGAVGRGVEELMRVGELVRLIPGDNPAFRPWRRWAAEGLRRLDRLEEATALAEAELILARRWGAAHAIGAALHQLGLVTSGAHREQHLRHAVATLAGSGARVEHARALVDLGATLRRTNRRVDARAYLREGRKVAEQIGATGLAERANEEIAASGARPRKVLQTGMNSLTASERRVANLAVEGFSNKEIAQRLFVTVKTVEVHLSSVYRKLGIDSRSQIAGALTGGVTTSKVSGPLGAHP